MKRSSYTTRTVLVLALTLACPSALFFAIHFRQARFSVSPLNSSASTLPSLQGAAAVERLKQQGLYASLEEAITAMRYGIKPVPGGSEFVANNPAHQLQASFAVEGLELRATAQTWRLKMKLRTAGYRNQQI